jgi:DNA primase
MSERIPDDLIRQVINVTDIVQIISRYIKLIPSGKNYKGRCPFHTEKTASFSVDPYRRIFKCFGGGCGKSGNVITFLMEIEKFSFPEAFKFLAAEAGINYEQKQIKSTPELKKKQKLLNANNIALKFFIKNLYLGNSESEGARTYLYSRGFSDNDIKEFKLGLAMSGWSNLYNFIDKNNRDISGFKESALIKEGKQGFFDFFRSRIIIPIINSANQVIGFGGRVFYDTDYKESKDFSNPKYLNSSETYVFNKSKVLYGIDLARDEIRRKNSVIIVEGYMDRMALHRIGIKNCVAVLGTAFTEYHLKIISPIAENVYLFFDSDEPGRTATERAIEIFQKFNRKSEVIEIENYKDIDEIISSGVNVSFDFLRSKAIEDIDYLIKRNLLKYDIKKSDYKKKVVESLAWIIFNQKSKLVRQNYILKIADSLKCDRNHIIYELNMMKKKSNDKHITNKKGSIEHIADKNCFVNKKKHDVYGLWIIAFLISDYSFEKVKKESIDLIKDAKLKKLAEKIFAENKNPNNTRENYLAMLANSDFFEEVLDIIDQFPDDRLDALKMTDQILKKFRKKQLKKKIDNVKEKIAEISNNSVPDDPGVRDFILALNNEFIELMREYTSGSEA